MKDPAFFIRIASFLARYPRKPDWITLAAFHLRRCSPESSDSVALYDSTFFCNPFLYCKAAALSLCNMSLAFRRERSLILVLFHAFCITNAAAFSLQVVVK